MSPRESSNPNERISLPEEIREAQSKAVRLEWISLGVLAVITLLVFFVAGNSQTMKTAWAEDLLSMVPPLAFLVGMRVSRLLPSKMHPYGYHRAVGVGHVIASVALTGTALVLIFESVSGLIKAEHPSIGTMEVFGQSVWMGWLMVGVMVMTSWPAVVLGHIKLKYAKKLHDKILYADADMNKADWMTGVGSIIGVLGIGLGLWWMDATVALLVSASILYDGVTNLKASVLDLLDKQARTYDDSKPHPLAAKVNDTLDGLPWVERVGCRVRDQGHALHVEAFVIPKSNRVLKVETLKDAQELVSSLDWKLRDVVIAPVDNLPETLYTGRDYTEEQA